MWSTGWSGWSPHGAGAFRLRGSDRSGAPCRYAPRRPSSSCSPASLAVFEFYAAGPGVAARGGRGVPLAPCRLRPVGPCRRGGPASRLVSVVCSCTWWTSSATTWVAVDHRDRAAPLRRSPAGGRSAPAVPVWWVVVIVVVGTALFFGLALTTIERARFSTPDDRPGSPDRPNGIALRTDSPPVATWS